MCPSQKILNQTKNGTLTFCHHSKLFQFVFNNLCFELYEWELKKFNSFLKDLDANYWEKQLSCSIHNRKISISVGTNHFIILVNRRELQELKQLLSNKRNFPWLNARDINYTIIEN